MLKKMEYISKKTIFSWLTESIRLINEDDGEEKNVRDTLITNQNKKIKNIVNKRLKNKNSALAKNADKLGFANLDKEASMEKISKRKEVFNQLNVADEVNEKIKLVLTILKEYTNNNGGIRFNDIQRKCESGELPLTYNDFLKSKDLVDSIGLRYVYDKSVSNTELTDRFGIFWDGNEWDFSNFDVNNVTDAQTKCWLSTGGGENQRNRRYTDDEASLEIKRTVVTRYLDSVYGISWDAPNYTLGNAKVKNALLINFTSAFRCPAWNECLVKHACYARSGEQRLYDTTKISNDKKNLLWESIEGDKELEKNMFSLLRMYLVNFNQVKKVLGLKNIEKYTTIPFNMLPENILEVCKQNVRVNNIRLNENGDFISQWLLNRFDEFAEECKSIGVICAAYSCRNLDFSKIRNIIINASRRTMEGPSIARYFYAIPENMFNEIEDTYASKNISDKFNSITQVPKPLFSINENGEKIPNGNYYYKCPCGTYDGWKVNKKALTSKSKINCYQCHLCYEEPDENITKLLQNGGKYFIFVKAHGATRNLLDSSRIELINRECGLPLQYEIPISENKEYITENNSKEMQTEAHRVITNNCINSMRDHLNTFFANNTSETIQTKNTFNEMFNKIS